MKRPKRVVVTHQIPSVVVNVVLKDYRLRVCQDSGATKFLRRGSGWRTVNSSDSIVVAREAQKLASSIGKFKRKAINLMK